MFDYKNFLYILLAFALFSCSGVVVGSTLTGAYFTSSFYDVFETKNDYFLEQKVKTQVEALKKIREDIEFDADIMVRSRVIYSIGIAKDEKSRRYLLDYISSKYGKDYKIIDEIKIGESKTNFQDYMIKTSIKTRLTLTNGVRYSNYYIAVYNQDVVLIGIASTKYEASKVVEIASNTNGVKKILNYVEVKDINDY